MAHAGQQITVATAATMRVADTARTISRSSQDFVTPPARCQLVAIVTQQRAAASKPCPWQWSSAVKGLWSRNCERAPSITLSETRYCGLVHWTMCTTTVGFQGFIVPARPGPLPSRSKSAKHGPKLITGCNGGVSWKCIGPARTSRVRAFVLTFALVLCVRMILVTAAERVALLSQVNQKEYCAYDGYDKRQQGPAAAAACGTTPTTLCTLRRCSRRQ